MPERSPDGTHEAIVPLTLEELNLAIAKIESVLVKSQENLAAVNAAIESQEMHLNIQIAANEQKIEEFDETNKGDKEMHRKVFDEMSKQEEELRDNLLTLRGIFEDLDSLCKQQSEALRGLVAIRNASLTKVRPKGNA